MTSDDAYENTAHIPGGDTYPTRWRAEAETFRAALGARAERAVPYGEGRRETFDLFHPAGAATGTLVFFHGGYWKSFDPGTWSAFAAGGIEAGLSVAIPGYTLAPEARISRITREACAALAAIAARTDGPIAVAGHSAGGHLAARLLCADAMLPTSVVARLKVCVPISPLSDLRPLLATTMNDTLGLDEVEVQTESPALQAKALDVPVTVRIGGAERPAFLDQARWLADAWDAPLEIEAGRHHFDVIDGLRDKASPLMRSLLDRL